MSSDRPEIWTGRYGKNGKGYKETGGRRISVYAKYIKRPLDFILAFCGLMVLGIPLLILMFLVLLDIGFPVIFVQERIGKDEKPFNLYKLRSMKTAFDK